MSKSQSPKLSLAAPVTIPLDKLDLDPANVRKSPIDDAGIQDLAADIALRGLLQSLSVRPVLDADHQETGTYAVQAWRPPFPRAEAPRQAEEAGQKRAHPLHR